MQLPNRRLIWIGDAKDVFDGFPGVVKQAFGYALYLAQIGRFPPRAKALKGFGGAKVIELASAAMGSAYRVVYAIQFDDVVCVLHCFHKKSKKGIAMDAGDLATIKRRLADALREYGK